MPGDTPTGRPESSTRGRRTSTRSNAEEQEPCTSSAAEEPIPMETDHAEDVTQVTSAVDPNQARVSYISAVYLFQQRKTRDKLTVRHFVPTDGERTSSTEPLVNQILKNEILLLGESLQELLKNPNYAVIADLTKRLDPPEKAKTMEPIEVKIEESEAQGAAPSTSVLPSTSGGETNVERAARREAQVLARISDLRKNGLWSNSRLPKCVEPERNKTHWDYLLEEVKWMATDFRAETINKKKYAKAIVGAIAKQHRDKEIEVERAAEREIKEKKRMCAGIAKMVRDFWQGVDKVVDIRAKEILESRVRKARNKHLMFMIGQVDEMSNIVQERLVPSKTPSIASHDDDKEFELGEDSESDDEQTIASAEKSQRKDDVRIEVNALQNEANVEMDDFLSTLPPEYLKAYGLTQEDLAEMKAENQREREEAERRKLEPKVEEMEVDQPTTSTPAQAVKDEEKSQDKAAEDGNGDGRGVLENVDYVKLNSADSGERQQELANIAEEALKFQPKGYTLETTQVKTSVPFLIRGQLREYQMVGLDWMVTLYEKNLNGILADEMGLGKTIQTISLLAHLACSESIWGPHLIVVPTSVILNWEMEFKKWCPAFKILTYFGTAKERAEKRKGWMKQNCFHVCITSYKTVTQDIRAFKQRAWQYLILDEAQNIKNWKSQRWQALLNVRARRRLLLTGTPLQNSLMELWSLMHFLMPTIFSSHDDFKDWFSNPLTGMMEGSMEFNAPLIQRLHKVLRPFILRRLKKEVEKQLPEKTEHVIHCSLSKRQRYLYDDFMSRRSTKENLKSGNMMSVLNIVMQLRKCCNHPNLFEPRPVLAPFVVPKLQMEVPSYLFNISEQNPEVEPIPDCLNLRHLFGWQSQVSSTKPMIEEIETMEEVLDLTPPEVDGFRFNRTTYTLKSGRDEGIGSEEEGRVNGTNGHNPATGARVGTPNAAGRAATIRTRTVMNTAPLSITTDRSGFHYTMANNGRGMLDERAPHSPPLKRAKLTGQATNWAEYVPQRVLEKMEEAKMNKLEIARRRFGLIRQPIVPYELAALLYEEVCGSFSKLQTENEEQVQESLMDYASLLVDRFGMFVEPVLTDAWQCRPSSSGLPSYIRSKHRKIEKVSRSLLLKSSTDLETKIEIARSLQFPELRLIEYDCGKLQTLAALLRELYLHKHRCLIFTQMSKMLDVLQTFLSHHGYQYFRLDGTTGVEQRQAMMERFNADSKVFCFILSTRSGGVGINLTGADTVIFYDSDWNPTMDAQAQDRCHRIGQTRNVSIYRLISERTIEENILKKAMQKRRLGELAIDEAGFTPEFFKQSDNIRDLFDGEDVDVTAPSDVPLNEKELETALAKCEDEADVNAAKIAKAEARVDSAEFDETAKTPASNLAGGDEEADEKYMELIQQLKPIERFAINLLEAEYKPEFEEECKEAEAMIDQKREEWDKNLNENPTDDPQNILDDDPFNTDFIQSGNLLDEYIDLLDDLMPMWLPPSPPASDADFDLRMEDDAFDLLYEIDPMSEARLPQVTHELRRPLAEKQKQAVVTVADLLLTKDKDISVYDAVAKCLQMPPVDPVAASPAYTENSFIMDDNSQDSKVEQVEATSSTISTLPKPPKRRRTETRTSTKAESGVKRATTPPAPVREDCDYDGAEWNIVEDYALLQAVQLEFANAHLVEKSPLEGMVMNWELVANAVNKQTRFYRSPRQCSIRYQMFVRPKELGQLVAMDPITKKTMKVDLSTTELAHLRRGRMSTDSQYQHDYGALTDKKHINRFKMVKQVAARRQVQFWRGPRGLESRNLQSLSGSMPARHEAKMAEFEVRTNVVLDAEEVTTQTEEQIAAFEANKKKLAESRRPKFEIPVEKRFHTAVLRPYTVPLSNQYEAMPVRKNMRVPVPPLVEMPPPVHRPQQSQSVASSSSQGPSSSSHGGPSTPLQHQPQSLPSLQPLSQSSQQHQPSQSSQHPSQPPTLSQQQPMPIRQVGAGGPQSHGSTDGGPPSAPSNQGQQMSGGGGAGHGVHTVVSSSGSSLPSLQRRTASGSNVQFIQQGSIQQVGQGQSFVVVPSQSANGEGGQSQRVQYVQGTGRGYGNTVVMNARGGRLVRGGMQQQQRAYMMGDRQYTIPQVVPVRVMPTNQQRVMAGAQRRNQPMPGTVAAMVLPNRSNNGVPQMRPIQRPAGTYGSHTRLNVVVSGQNMRAVGQAGIVGQGQTVRRQLVSRPLNQRADPTPTVAQVVVAPPSGMTTQGGGPPVLHMQRSIQQQQQQQQAPVQQQQQPQQQQPQQQQQQQQQSQQQVPTSSSDAVPSPAAPSAPAPPSSATVSSSTSNTPSAPVSSTSQNKP